MKLSDALPFLEGWELYIHSKIKTITNGSEEQVYSELCNGWLLGLDCLMTDAYGTIIVEYLGRVMKYNPQSSFPYGGVEPPPHGFYCPLYIRPSTLSTAGVYASSIVTSAYPVPIKGTIKITLALTLDSTQASATIGAAFSSIRILDRNAFIRSVRKFKYGWLGWIFGAISKIPGLKYVGIPNEIKEVVG